MNISDENISKAIKWIISVSLFFLAIYFMHRLRSVLVPFAISVILAYMLNPVVLILEHRLSFSRGFASVSVVLIVVASVLGVALSVIPAFISQATSLNAQLTTYLQRNPASEASIFYSSFSLRDVLAYLPDIMPQIVDVILGTVNAVSGIFNAFIIVLYTTFLLIDYKRLAIGVKSLVPRRYMTPIQKVVADVRQSMQLYFRSQGTIAIIVGILLAVGFAIIDLPLGIVLGLAMGLLNMVPYLQLAAVPFAVLLAMSKALQDGTPFWFEIGLTMLVLVIVQIIQEAILNPRIMGRTYSMSPVAILLSISVWGSLLGLLGMILALPMTALVISYVRYFISNKEHYHAKYGQLLRKRHKQQ